MFREYLQFLWEESNLRNAAFSFALSVGAVSCKLFRFSLILWPSGCR